MESPKASADGQVRLWTDQTIIHFLECSNLNTDLDKGNVIALVQLITWEMGTPNSPSNFPGQLTIVTQVRCQVCCDGWLLSNMATHMNLPPHFIL